MAGAAKNAEGLEGEAESVARLAHPRGFDKCPVCWTLVVCDAVLTECGHKFCAPCLATLSAQSFSFTCPSCRATCLTVKTMPAAKIYRETKQFTCPAAECAAAGAPPVMTLKEFDAHIRRACPGRSIECGCGALVKAAAYAEHRRSEHPESRCAVCGGAVFAKLAHVCAEEPVDCADCGRAVRRRHLAAHRRECPRRPAKCPTCGLAGTLDAIAPHRRACTLEPCPYCARLFRADKLRLHACHAKPVPCPLDECSFTGPYGSLAPHMATHPQLAVTGISLVDEPSLYVVSSETTPTESRVARKVGDFPDKILIRYFGFVAGADEFVPKTSPRLSLLPDVPASHFSPVTLHHLFSDRKSSNIQSVFAQGLLTHRESEAVAKLEIQYKCHASHFALGASFPSLLGAPSF